MVTDIGNGLEVTMILWCRVHSNSNLCTQVNTKVAQLLCKTFHKAISKDTSQGLTRISNAKSIRTMLSCSTKWWRSWTESKTMRKDWLVFPRLWWQQTQSEASQRLEQEEEQSAKLFLSLRRSHLSFKMASITWVTLHIEEFYSQEGVQDNKYNWHQSLTRVLTQPQPSKSNNRLWVRPSMSIQARNRVRSAHLKTGYPWVSGPSIQAKINLSSIKASLAQMGKTPCSKCARKANL